MHIRDCRGGKPVPGDVVTFTMESSPTTPDRMKASNVEGGSGPLDTGKGKGKNKGKGGALGVMGNGSCRGTVKSFNAMKGWGFIEYGDQDIFVHIRDCIGSQPQTGDMVAFDLEESPAKPGSQKAVHVTGGSAPLGGGEKGFGKGGGGFDGGFDMTGSFPTGSFGMGGFPVGFDGGFPMGGFPPMQPPMFPMGPGGPGFGMPNGFPMGGAGGFGDMGGMPMGKGGKGKGKGGKGKGGGNRGK